MPRLASVERSTVDQKGIAPAHDRTNVLSLPLWYSSRVFHYVLHGRARQRAHQAINLTKHDVRMDLDSTQSARTPAGLC